MSTESSILNDTDLIMFTKPTDMEFELDIKLLATEFYEGTVCIKKFFLSFFCVCVLDVLVNFLIILLLLVL